MDKTDTPQFRPSIPPLPAGALGAAALLGFYFLLLSIANSREHAWERFQGMWYWILLLAAGFATQVGLFVHARNYLTRQARAGATAGLAGSGTLSSGSMVACCAHHLSDLLPVFGVSAAVAFLDRYQPFFIALGLLSNLVGITVMLSVIQKHHLYSDRGLLPRILKRDMTKMRNVIIAFSLVVLAVVFLTSCMNQGFTTGSDQPAGGSVPRPGAGAGAGTLPLSPKTNDENGITIKVEPETIAAGQPATFRISVDTHSGSLDFSLAGAAVLKDDRGNEYQPQEWQGSSGGHHVSGTIVFGSLKDQPRSLVLVLKGIGGVSERTFTWS